MKIKCSICKSRFLVPDEEVRKVEREEVRSQCPKCDSPLTFKNPFWSEKGEAVEEKVLEEVEEKGVEEVEEKVEARAPGPGVRIKGILQGRAVWIGIISITIVALIAVLVYFLWSFRAGSLYREAMSLYREGEVRKGYKDLFLYLEKYPRHKFITNARETISGIHKQLSSEAASAFEKGDIEGAEEQLAFLYDCGEAGPNVLALLAGIYFEKRNIERAYLVAKDVINRFSHSTAPEVYLTLGLEAMRRGNFVDADAFLVKAKGLLVKDKTKETLLPLIYFLSGNVYTNLRMPVKAGEMFEKYLISGPHKRDELIDEYKMWGIIHDMTEETKLFTYFANIRKAPYFKARRVASIRVGDPVRVFFSLGDWARIFYKGRSIAYIYRPLIFEIDIDKATSSGKYGKLFSPSPITVVLTRLTYKDEFAGIKYLYPVDFKGRWKEEENRPTITVGFHYNPEEIKENFKDEFEFSPDEGLRARFLSVQGFMRGLMVSHLRPVSLRIANRKKSTRLLYQDTNYLFILKKPNGDSLELRGSLHEKELSFSPEIKIRILDESSEGKMELRDEELFFPCTKTSVKEDLVSPTEGCDVFLKALLEFFDLT